MNWILSSGALTQGGAVGLLALTVGGVISGRLVPRRVVEDVRADRDARIAAEQRHAEEWKTAHDTLAAATSTLVGQLPRVIDLVTATDAFIRSTHPPNSAKPNTAPTVNADGGGTR